MATDGQQGPLWVVPQMDSRGPCGLCHRWTAGALVGCTTDGQQGPWWVVPPRAFTDPRAQPLQVGKLALGVCDGQALRGTEGGGARVRPS